MNDGSLPEAAVRCALLFSLSDTVIVSDGNRQSFGCTADYASFMVFIVGYCHST